VRAHDVRYSLERLFRAGTEGFAGDPELGFTGIVGAAACLRRPATCDLSPGVQTDDSLGTVRIRLTRPNPQFLNRLAENFDVVPYGTPLTDRARGPVPGTGPYTVTRLVPDHRLELRRNPYFRQWSRAAQPDGYPDSIVVDIGPITAATVDQLTPTAVCVWRTARTERAPAGSGLLTVSNAAGRRPAAHADQVAADEGVRPRGSARLARTVGLWLRRRASSTTWH
jgi:ABC-type transport system substrate-binding protein